jgi:alpha-beta hydrolase superfamily lysophospholipase
MRVLAVVLLLVPGLAFGGVTRAKRDRYVAVATGTLTAVANGAVSSVWVPWAGRIVDAIVYQQGAGTGGTSLTVDLKTTGGTSLLATLPVLTLASGADKLTDASGALALPSGWTRHVLKTDATVTVTKGQRIAISTVETGTYSPHPAFQVVLYIEPSP